MADKKPTPEVVETKKSEMETIFIPRLRGDKPDAGEWFCVNGKAYLVKKGENVEVPKAVAEAYRNSLMSKNKADEYKANAAKA